MLQAGALPRHVHSRDPEVCSPKILSTRDHATQVVLGVLGCPNLPAAPLGDEASSTTSAEHAGEPGVGCLFAAVRGGGAFVAPLSGGVQNLVRYGICSSA